MKNLALVVILITAACAMIIAPGRDFRVLKTEPENGGIWNRDYVIIYFSKPVCLPSLKKAINTSPRRAKEIKLRTSSTAIIWYVYQSQTCFSLTIKRWLTDAWGKETLGQDYTFHWFTDDQRK